VCCGGKISKTTGNGLTDRERERAWGRSLVPAGDQLVFKRAVAFADGREEYYATRKKVERRSLKRGHGDHCAVGEEGEQLQSTA
jgi:hypothetical protein